MAHHFYPTAEQTVQAALDIARARWAAAPEHIKAKVHAVVAVLNADVIDRRTKLTFEGENTPGLHLAHRVLASRR